MRVDLQAHRDEPGEGDLPPKDPGRRGRPQAEAAAAAEQQEQPGEGKHPVPTGTHRSTVRAAHVFPEGLL